MPRCETHVITQCPTWPGTCDGTGMSAKTLLLGAFGFVALLSMTNAACSSPTDVDSGSSEAAFSGGHYGYGYYGGGYYGGGDLAEDSSL